ncbi:MAG: hypothetical protein ABR503_16810, partial [Chitinophagaceae bacterium]
ISNLFTISNVSGLGVERIVSLIPQWGIKRTVGKRMKFEFALGYGVAHSFDESKTEGSLGLDLRFGYNIK